MFVAKNRLRQLTGTCVIALTFAGIMLYTGCDSGDVLGPPDHGVEQIVISPENASLAVGEQQQFSAFALTADGDTVDTANLDIQWEWWSSDSSVFTVEEGGLATAHNPGEEFCIVEATILVGSSNFTGRDSARVVVF